MAASNRTARSSRSDRRKSHLRVESLEGRIVLTAGMAFDARSGVLTIEGGAANDVCVVRQTGQTLSASLNLGGGATETRSLKTSDVKLIVFKGLGGDDSFTNESRIRAVANGGLGNDTLRGGRNADEIRGGQGSDKLFGNGGNDILWGGGGDDFAEGGEGNDREYGEAGDDDLHGGRGSDTISGGLGDDDIYGDEDNDDLTGDDGDDHLNGHQGRDRIRGGGGLDREDDADDGFDDGDDDGDGYDNDHDRPVNPGVATPIVFSAEGTAQLTGTTASERDRQYYSFTATATQTLNVSIAADANGRYAELEVKDGVTGRELLELEPSEDGISTGQLAVVAGTSYVIKVNSPFDHIPVGYTVGLLLDDAPISPVVGTEIVFNAVGYARIAGAVTGESKAVYSFTATASGTVSVNLLPGAGGRYAEVEVEERATGRDVLELEPNERRGRTSGTFAMVAGQTYVFEIESPFDRSGVDFTIDIQLS